MNGRRMIKALCIIFSILVFKIACGQDYLVTTSNDTLRGEIKLLNFGPEPKVLLQETGSKKKSAYSIIEVKAFNESDETYHTIRATEGYVFMKLIRNGYLSLYAFNSENQQQWSGRYLSTVDGRSLEVPNLGFKKRLTTFLEDCPDVSKAVDEGDLRKSDLEEIVNSYNACIEQRTQQLTEEKKSNTGQTENEVLTGKWDTLERAVLEHPDFDSKSDASEMIKDIKVKLKRSEKIPNFLIEGLKNNLQGSSTLLKLLEEAVASLEK
jgi:hypothetical protein